MDRNFPDFIEAYLKYSDGHESTERLRLWSCISILGAALERKTYLNFGYFNIFPNLYVMIIGKSGLVKKSTSTAIAVDLLKEVPDFRIMSDKMTAASLIQQMESAYKPYDVNGQQAKQSPLFAYASELAVFMMEVFGNTIELLTTFYDCQPNDPDKPWTYKTKNSGESTIYGPCLSILGASTHEWLRKCISPSEMEGGFASRCVFVVENKPPQKLIPWPELNGEKGMMKLKLIDDLIMINEMFGEIRPTKSLKKRYAQWYEYQMREIIPRNKDPRFVGYLSRKGTLLLKLAMIRSVSLGESFIVTPEHFNWAGEKVKDIEPGMMNAFTGREADGDITGFDIMDWIEHQPDGYVSTRQITEKFGDPKKNTILSKALTRLIDMNKLEFSFDNNDQYYSIPGAKPFTETKPL